MRSLSRRPGFSLTALALLALGIGANTALFSLVDTVLLRPLPFPDPQQLVAVLEASSAGSQKESLLAPVRIEDWNRLSRAFTAIAGAYSESVTDTSGAEPERLASLRVSPRYFAVYGMPPLVGRHLRHVDYGPATPAAEIVGVVGDVKEDAFQAPVYPYVYNCAVAGGWPDPEYAVRTAADPRALMSSIRQLVRGIDPARAVFGVRTLEEELDQTLDRPRTNARLLSTRWNRCGWSNI